jgi:small subunit ribosomal protein S6e
MAKYKIVLSDPETGKSQLLEVEGPRAVPLVGRKLRETIDGSALGFGGHKIQIIGGSDKDGFPMRPDIHGGVKTRVILSKGVGFHSTKRGERKRRTIRGNVITEEIIQINMKIVEKPKKAKKPEPSKEEEKKEKSKGTTEKTEEKPEAKTKPEVKKEAEKVSEKKEQDTKTQPSPEEQST